MPKRIIILERNSASPRMTFRVAFWPDVPATLKPFYADPAAASQFKDATPGEISALQSGAVVEIVETLHFVPGTSIAQIKSELISRFTRVQVEVNERLDWERYGTFWDGTTWTNA